MRVEVSETYRHSPQAVFDVFADITAYPEFIYGIESVEILEQATQPPLQKLKVRAQVKTTSFAFGVVSRVQFNRPAGIIEVTYKLGPIKVGGAVISFTGSDISSTVRCVITAPLVPPQLREKILARQSEMTARYRKIFNDRVAEKLEVKARHPLRKMADLPMPPFPFG